MSSPESSREGSPHHTSQPSTNPLNDMFDSDVESIKALKNPETHAAPGTDDEDMPDRARGQAEGVDEDEVMMDEVMMDDDQGAGLFGSDDEDEAPGKTLDRQRDLDDSELDSGDDEGREDRVRAGSVSDSDSGRDKSVVYASIGRMPIPEGSDGELYLLKFPSFLSVEPRMFRYETFQVPTSDHHSRHASSTFNAFTVANTTLRWRRSPHDKESLQSNARVLRWSDGSLTLQLANNPMEQYELPPKALAPPQYNPVKPTPTMVQSRNAVNGQKTPAYDPKMDSYTYLMAPQESASLLRSTNHITTSLTVLPGNESNDEALVRLHESLAKAVKGKGGIAGGITRISISEDPELQKKRAEAAERDKMKAQRRKEQAEQREKQRASKSNKPGRPGGRYGHGLSAGVLEDDEMATSGGMGRKRGVQPSKKKAPRRRDDYDSDDDDRPRYYAKEDEYDRADDFLADSDEEEEYEGDGKDDDEDIDEGIDEVDEEAEEKEERADRKRDRKVERKRGSEPRKEEASAGGGAVAGGARSKRRRIVDDDDDE